MLIPALDQAPILCLVDRVSASLAAGMVYYHLCLFVPRAMEVRAAQGFGNGYSSALISTRSG